MNDLEPKLGPEYIQSTLYYDEPITFTNAYKYILDAIKVFNQQEADKKQDIPDNIINNYFE